MDAPRIDCTVGRFFLQAKGVKSAEIHRLSWWGMQLRTIRQRKVYEWGECFTTAKEIGRPSTLRT